MNIIECANHAKEVFRKGPHTVARYKRYNASALHLPWTVEFWHTGKVIFRNGYNQETDQLMGSLLSQEWEYDEPESI